MSESSNEKSEDTQGISDEQLPDELLPSEDNPLAEPLTDEEAPDDIEELDLMGDGSSGDSEDAEEGENGEPPPADERE